MARRTKDAPGRVTPKGTPPTERGAKASAGRLARSSSATETVPGGRRTGPAGATRPAGARTASSGRYTAPIPEEYRSSPVYVPVIMLAFFAAGVLAIILNYLSLLPASPSNWYLVGGLVGIIAGFVVATRYR